MSDVSPSVFVSYCWSSFEHQEWVAKLSESLVHDGVDVKLDKWDLKEGHDKNSFMESMVQDSSITKVLMIFDREYVKRANDKAGGVGTETQIISQEVYSRTDQEKFVGVVCEKDESGNSCVPIYYASRMYIDLSDEATYHEKYEQLLRWIYDKPLYIKPEIGVKPSFLDDESRSLSSETLSSHRALMDAIKNNKQNIVSLSNVYVDAVSKELPKYVVANQEPDDLNDDIFNKINDFDPIRNQILDLFHVVSKFNVHEDLLKSIRNLFESLIEFCVPTRNVSRYKETQFDNFRFLAYELFLYFSAYMIKEERFSEFDSFLRAGFYCESLTDFGHYDTPLVDYTFFFDSFRSCEYRNKRLGLNVSEPLASLIKERSDTSSLSHMYLAQADIVLYIRYIVQSQSVRCVNLWVPINIIYYLRLQHSPFEAFLRAKDKVFFDRLKKIILVDSKEKLDDSSIKELLSGSSIMPRSIFGSSNIYSIANIKEWSTANI